MSIYLIDVHMRTHTCPADPEEHPIHIARTIVHVTPGRACQRPVTIDSGNRTVTIPCGRHVPADRQCDACRTVITIRTVTAEYLRYQDSETNPTRRIPDGDAPNPCTVCGQPLAAQLADWGHHLLCIPRRNPKRATRQATNPTRTIAKRAVA